MRKHKSLDPELIKRRQEHWDACIANNGEMGSLVGLDYAGMDLVQVKCSAIVMEKYNKKSYPDQARGVYYWQDDPSYFWHKKYRK